MRDHLTIKKHQYSAKNTLLQDFCRFFALRQHSFSHLKKGALTFALIVVPGSITIELPLTTPDAPTPTPIHSDALNDTILRLDEPIILHFDEARDKNEIIIDLHPATPFTIEWSPSHTLATITPKDLWHLDESYTLSISHAQQSAPSTLLAFETTDGPQIIASNTEDFTGPLIIKKGTSITFALDRTSEEYNFRAITRPNIPTEITRNDRTLIVTFTQTHKHKESLDVLIYIKHKTAEESDYRPLYQTTFLVKSPTPDQWPKKVDERLAIARDVKESRIADGKYIDIDLTTHITTLFENGVIVANYINSPGAKSTPTLTGTFKVENKAPKPISKSFGVYLPYWLAFTPDGKYGIHDLIEYPIGHPDAPLGGKEASSSIDNAISPGCVRHISKESKAIYDWAPVGTPIIIYN